MFRLVLTLIPVPLESASDAISTSQLKFLRNALKIAKRTDR